MSVKVQAKCKAKDCPQVLSFQTQRPLQSFQAQPYLPKGTWPLLFVCPICTYLNYFDSTDFHPVADSEITGSSNECLWRVEILCSDTCCTSPLVLHTIASKTSDPYDVAHRVEARAEQGECGEGHIHLGDEVRLKAAPTQVECD
jgi:hypothetical protein